MNTRICYHCHKNEAKPFSNFCQECLGSSRPLYFRPEPSQKIPPWTLILFVGAVATAVWLIFTLLA